MLNKKENGTTAIGGEKSTGKRPADEWIRKAGLGVAIFILIWWIRLPLMDFVAFVADREVFISYILSFGLLGPLVLAAFQLIQVLSGPVPGQAVVIAAGYIYGMLPGFLFNEATIGLASLVAFSLARRFGRPLVKRLFRAETVDQWDQRARQQGFSFFLICFLLPFAPADLINYVAGLSSLRRREFLLASLIGRAPLNLFWTAVGAYGFELADAPIPRWAWIALILVGAGALAGGQYMFLKHQKRLAKDKHLVTAES